MSMPLGDWDFIRSMPTTTNALKGLTAGDNFHESLLRAWHIVEQAKSLLERGTPADVVLHIINHLEKK